MSGSNWGKSDTIIALIIAIFIAIPLVWGLVKQDHKNEVAQINHTKQNDDHTYRGPAEGYWMPEFAARDTYAQWAMTLFAFIATIASIVAVVLLKRTLHETSAAAISAAESTRIMRDQQRPWLLIENNMFGDFLVTDINEKGHSYDLEIRWRFHYWFHNRGKSIAHIREIKSHWVCLDDWYFLDEILEQFSNEKINFLRGGGGPVFAGEITDSKPSYGSNLIRKQSPNSKYFAHIVSVKYTDENRELDGADIRCFILQQMGPAIGPMTTEYRSHDSFRIIR